MDAVVTRDFWDKEDPEQTIYHVGDKFSGTAARVGELADGGFVKKKATRAPRKPRGE